ncbi:MAG: type VII secretion protein EsaA, partial [Lachnospiraceae bacterium]|nr:type VII secretion protein EsaA [Lachnospiraceae bacterium]
MKGKDLFGKNKHIIGMIIVTILAVLFLMYLAFGSSQVHKVGNESSTNLHYVLVNEDLGGNFNNKNYRLGDLFVKRIYGDTSNSWKTTSRSVANAGFKDGTYDVEIIIPQNFSKDLLSLAAFNPNKAQIEYHIKPGINSLVNSNIEKRVGEILNQFNQSIVQMYFSSILSNISDAQRNVLNIVANENDNKKTLVTNINNPFKTYPVNLQSILGEESTLASTNKSWQDSQNAFTSSTTNMLNTFSTGLNGKVGEITDFGTLAKEISDLNIKNGQEYINQQNISDTENYKKQYDLIMGLMNSQMEELYKKGDGETSEDTGTYVDVKNDIEKYLQDSVDTVKTKIEELKTEKESLVSLRKDIALKYFGEEDATPGNEDNEKVKEAIVNLIDTGAKGDKSLVKGYINKIKDQVGNIQNTLENNLITMHENGEITDTDFEKYEKEIALVRKFASDEGVSFSTARTLAIINSDNSDEEKTGDFTKPLSLALPVGETTILDLDKADNTSLSLANKETLAKEIGKASKKAGLDCQVESYGTNGLKITLSDLPSSSENSNVENQDDSVITGTTENTNTQSPVVSDENGDDNEKGIDTNTSSPVKTTLSVDLPIELKWTYGNKFKTTEYMETTYDWVTTNPEVKNSKEVVGSGTLGAYHDLDVRARTITQNLGEIAGQLGELKSAADEITFLFGESNETGVEDFDNYYYHAITLNGGIRLRDSADPTSIYYSYGSLTLTQKKQYIPS